MRSLLMKQRLWLRAGGIALIMALATLVLSLGLPVRPAFAQQPTGSIPTVTGTPRGPYVTVYSNENQIDVLSGPDSESYPQIGILLAGQSVPAIGVSEDKYWVQIIYQGVPGGKGWVYGLYVALTGAEPPVVEAPPTATPRTTPTIDPTFAAAYGLQLVASQLPTFTKPAELNIPTFTSSQSAGSKVPYGLIILGLVLVGVLGAIVSFVRGSR